VHTRRHSAGDNKYLTTEITNDITHVGQLIAEGLLRVQVKNNRRKSNPPKQKLKMVKASNRHPTSSTTSSTATVQQQPSDPLSGVMATSKKQVEIQMYLSKFKIVGAAHAQESQSLQAGSHLARHRLHLRPAE
jgi:hypothetical protein